MIRTTSKALAFLMLASAVATAQDPGRAGRDRRDPANMAAARQAIEKLIRERVQPTDDQMAKLRQIDQQYVPRRIQLDREEQQVRRELRQAMLDTANVDQMKIGQLLDRMVAFPGRKAALMEDEQKSLAQVLSPLQRAKFNAIQEQLRRRIEQGRGGPPPGRGRPPQLH